MSTMKVINVQHPSASSPNIVNDSSGNVGIGTSTPSDKLNVVTSATNAGVTVSGSADPQYYLSSLGGNTARYKIGDSQSMVQMGSWSNISVGVYVNGSQVSLYDTSGNFKFNSGYGSVATAYGCRAWVQFDGTTAPGTIRASGNVSSVTRNSTGNYTANFTNSMPDANYATSSMCADDGVTPMFISSAPAGTRSTSAFQFYTSRTTAVQSNSAYISLAVFR